MMGPRRPQGGSVVVDEPLKLELWKRRKALNGAQRLNGVNVLNNILMVEGRRPKKSRTSSGLVFVTWKELSRTLTAWW
jgi:hypothetical protein